jgi:hypothetical protein
MLEKEIKGFEGLYTIDCYGRVYSVRSKKYLKQRFDKDGYLRVHLCNHGINIIAFVHRLVAVAFVENDNPKEKDTVDHIDADKTNNYYLNLRWLSRSDNTSIANKRRDCSNMFKKVRSINVKTGEVQDFISMTECAKCIGCNITDIGAVIYGRQLTARGHKFELI